MIFELLYSKMDYKRHTKHAALWICDLLTPSYEIYRSDPCHDLGNN